MSHMLTHVWPKKMTVTEYREIGYAGTKRPCITTLKKWIKRGLIPGQKEGTLYFVWVNQALQLVPPPDPNVVSNVGTGNALADGILAKHAQRSHGRKPNKKSKHESA